MSIAVSIAAHRSSGTGRQAGKQGSRTSGGNLPMPINGRRVAGGRPLEACRLRGRAHIHLITCAGPDPSQRKNYNVDVHGSENGFARSLQASRSVLGEHIARQTRACASAQMHTRAFRDAPSRLPLDPSVPQKPRATHVVSLA